MDTPSSSIDKLLRIMAALRTPETGCPWDLQQDFASIAPYTIEEAYEVVDAIRRHDFADLKNELGDLLLQVVFHARLAEEKKHFAFDDVVNAICDKMVRRHPHVFGDAVVQDIQRNWDDIKETERAEKHGGPDAPSLMDDIPLPLPGLTRAVKIQKRAARVDFDWHDAKQIFAKLSEEIDEFTEASASTNATNQRERMNDELGDMLFVMANLARHYGIDPEAAIRSTNAKFERRFRWMEAQADLSELSLDDMETLWQAAKAHTS